MHAAARQPNFAMLLAIAWLLLVLQLVIQYWPETALTLNDTDDAMRLVEVREFLAGHGWFDLHMSRVQPPAGYDPHWSRLIDAGLAGTFILFHQVFDTAFAERLMRATWPLLWLAPAMIGAAAIAWRLAGREAALIVLLFAVIGLPALQQFKPGRIDHHNVQIAIALLTVAATVWSDQRRWCAAAAGALTGLGLAIGFEGMPFLVLCAGAMALRYVHDAESDRALRSYGVAVAASTVIAFFVSVAPAHWTHSACDAIAINSTAAVVVGGLGLALISRCGAASPWTRAGLLAAVTLGAALVFVLAEPRCLGGPYAMVDTAVKPIWLAHVREMQPLLGVFSDNPSVGLGLLSFPAVGVIATAVLAWRGPWRSDVGFLVAGAALLLAFAMMFAAVKAYAYAVWLAMPLVAILALRLCEALRLHALVPRFVAGLLLAPAVLSAGIITIADAAGLNRTVPNDPARDTCFSSASYAPLAALPAGLVATDLDYGPFVLALTPHAVVAAPYHRLSTGITAAQEIFAAPPDKAHRIIDGLHADYVVTCGARGPVGLTETQKTASLWGRLRAGDVPDWLTPEPPAPGQAFKIYRVKS
jgi:hypothetical protein